MVTSPWSEPDYPAADLLRDVFGPVLFRLLELDPRLLTWNGSVIPELARTIYERQLPARTLDPVLLAVLADALEEAGCGDTELSEHLRSPGPLRPSLTNTFHPFSDSRDCRSIFSWTGSYWRGSEQPETSMRSSTPQ